LAIGIPLFFVLNLRINQPNSDYLAEDREGSVSPSVNLEAGSFNLTEDTFWSDLGALAAAVEPPTASSFIKAIRIMIF
jgi:hypothetical protein